MERLRKTHMDLFFVPVGNSDVDFHKTMAAISDGTVLDCRQGRRLARRQYLTTRLLDPIGLIAGTQTRGSDYDLSSEDKEDLMNIQKSAKRHFDENVRISNSPNRDAYHESKSKTLPPIGSRVRRGPDWHYRQQDSNGTGTVIGHAGNDQQLWIEWDADENQNVYMYGALGYDVLIVDEPRKLKPGEKIAVGCKVVPGKDWQNTDGNVNLGVVIKVKRNKKKAKVRWNNGKRGSYMYDDIQQVQVKTEADSRKVWFFYLFVDWVVSRTDTVK
ncbi:uncharacterized protein LOC132760322 [Ruditapes philippinarum]|uniref:uncharacterized protein LOC132760322 n=1 Tax=Ruditapes philippinarum TaxID=129788 RepID=UPI00295A8D7F|nr:uncharacterized protein LOC132760322 [Ruditapes philippinarum]